MSAGTLERERLGEVELIRIINPPLNVMNFDMRGQLRAAVDEIEANREIRALVITGAGHRAFCAGADLAGYKGGKLPFDSADGLVEYDEVYSRIEHLRVPSIAAINGHCLGTGLDLAMACDIRIAGDKALFRAPSVRMGMVANTVRLTQVLGPAVARYLCLTGKTIDAAEAARIGVVIQAIPQDRLMDEALALAKAIASRAPLAVAAAKKSIDYATDHSPLDALRKESELCIGLKETHDHKMAVEAFFKGETPKFEDR